MRMILALALALVACKEKSEPISKASCQTTASMTCEDYDSKGAPYLDRRAADCKQIHGTWAKTACPTTGVLGSCRETTPNWTRTRHYYAGTSVDLGRTKVECGAFGTWLEPAPAPAP